MRLFLLTLLCHIMASVFPQDQPQRPTSYNYQRGMEALEKENTTEALEYFNKEIKDNPKNGYAFTWIALIRHSQEEYGRALTAANLALQNLPKKDVEFLATAHNVRAEVHLSLQDTIHAMNDYALSIKANPTDDNAYEERAQIYYEQAKYDLADADYNQLIKLDQGGVMGYMGIGRNRNAQQLWDEAIRQFDHVTKLHPTYSYAFAFRAESHLGKKDWDKATDDITTALKIDGNSKAFYLMQQLDDAPFTQLKAKLQIQAAKETNEAKWPYYNGTIHESRKCYQQAINFYEEAVRRDNSLTFLERIAECYWEDYQYENCMQTIENGLNMDPENLSLLTKKANTLYEMGQSKEAIAQWDSILAKYPDHAFGYYRRGWFKENSRDIDGAINDMSLSITLNPKQVYAYISRADMYKLQGNDELAKEDYEKVIALENESKNYDNIQFAYKELGNDHKAIEMMDSIIAREPADMGNYHNAACLYARMGRKTDALQYLEKALSMGFKRFAHISNDDDLDVLRDMQEFKTLIQKYGDRAKEQSPHTKTPNRQPGMDKTVEVPFTKGSDNGLCNVKCTINGLPLYFIFDTGASDVSLSQIEATFMMKNDYLSKNDVIGNTYFYDATGNVNVGTVINLKKVDFAGLELSNVKASVVQNQKAPLLLGQSVLGRLGKIEIDNSKHVLRITDKLY